MKEFRDNAEVKKVKSLLKQEYTLRERESRQSGEELGVYKWLTFKRYTTWKVSFKFYLG